MPFCPECGKPVAPNAKFCRNCGAYQLEDIPSAPVPAPAVASVPVPAPAIPVKPVKAPPVPPKVVVQQPLTESFCGSCNSPLSPSEKFCGICGTRAGQTAPASPPEPSLTTPVHIPPPVPISLPVSSPLPVMGEPAGVRTCKACGNVIKPGDKYCSKCLVMVRDNQPPAAAPVRQPVQPSPLPAPISPPVPSPAQVLGEPAGVRTCKACGNIIKPGDKYCSKCLVIVQDNQPPAAAPVQPPVQPSPAAALGSYICSSCGSPITGTEKFCGICGTPVVAARVPADAQPARKTCSACGAPVNTTTKFCGGCGAPVGAPFRPATIAPSAEYAGVTPAVPQGIEQVIGVIGNSRKMKMLGAAWDTYALVVTDRRMIFAQLTADMLNAAYREAAERAKVEGKGFLGQVAHQMSIAFQYCQKYETMPPEFTLTETKGNRAIENVRISAVNLKEKPNNGSMEFSEFIMTVQSTDGKFEFHIGEDDRFINILKAAYGDKVHMPSGYYRADGARIKLF